MTPVHLDLSAERWHGQAKPSHEAELGREATRNLRNMARVRPLQVVP